VAREIGLERTRGEGGRKANYATNPLKVISHSRSTLVELELTPAGSSVSTEDSSITGARSGGPNRLPLFAFNNPQTCLLLRSCRIDPPPSGYEEEKANGK